MANQSESIRGKAALAPFMVNAFSRVHTSEPDSLCPQSEPKWRRGRSLSLLTLTHDDEPFCVRC